MGQSPRPDQDWQRPLFLFVLVVCAWGGFVGALSILSPLITVPGMAAFAVAFGLVTVSALSAGALVPDVSIRGTGLLTLSGLSALAAVAVLGPSEPGPASAAAVTVGLLVAGGAVGAAVGGRIEQPGHLLIVVVASILVDTFSVLHSFGPTAHVVARPQVIAIIALPWPVLGTSEVTPVLGVGDVIFAALYLAASRRHGLGRLRTAIALGVGLVATAAVVVATAAPAPALVGMGLAVLVAHKAARRLPAPDRRLGRMILAGLAVVWAALWLFDLA